MVTVASADDSGTIARMLHDFNREFGEPSPGPATLERRVRRHLENGTRTWLLAAEGPRGMAQVKLQDTIWSDDPVVVIEELYVAPDDRGRGAGRALMTSALSLARERGASLAAVVTGEDDVAARRLYESLGFSNRIEGAGGSRSLYYEMDVQST